MSYTEAPPLGPVPAGCVGGDDAVTDGFSRRFYRETQSGEWATVDVAFYYGQRPHDEGKEPQPVTLNCEMECSVVEGDSYDTPDEVYTEVRYVEVSECDGTPTEERAQAACAEFDPAALTWDGTWPVPDECWKV